MQNRAPLTQAEKECVYLGKTHGWTLTNLAVEVRCSFECARKWWRRGRDYGLQGLRACRCGRSATGILSQFDRRVADKALTLKHRHPGWGADRVLVELERDPELEGLRLPHRSRLAAFFKACCPECVAARRARQPPALRPPDVTGVHEMWQLDCQEGLLLRNGQRVTICSIRDPLGAAMIASQAFEVTTARHWRKLDWTQFRQVLRGAFTEWQTLPDSVQTDNELGLAGGPNDPFPGRLTLWLVGLGVKHRLIRPGHPTDQPHIERNHRTVDGLVLSDDATADLPRLQQTLNQERATYNHDFPCHASDCAGRPPLIAHPELLHSRRSYQPELELALFEQQRVYDYLSTFCFQRKVSATGRVSLGRQFYSLGRSHAGEIVQVRFDPARHQWVFLTEAGEEITRRDPKGLSMQELTGLDPTACEPTPPVQLTLPCFVA